MYEAIRDYNETEFQNTEFNNSNIINISYNEHIIDTVKTGDACLSIFKTASEIINEERLRVSTLDKDKDARELPVNKLTGHKSQENEKLRVFTSDRDKKAQSKQSINNTVQKSTYENDKLQMKISSGFVCAREIHEHNVIKSNITSSKSKVLRSKADKNVKRVVKTVYEQILASAQSSKTSMNERRDVSSETELKVDNIIDSVKTKNENKHEIKNKRGYESIACHEDDIKSVKKKKIVHNEYMIKQVIDKTNDNISKNIDKTILSDKIDIKTRKRTDTIININAVNDNLSRTTKNNTEKHLAIKANVELKRKEEIAHTSRSKHHKNSNSNRPADKLCKVPADKAMQFKTAEILKSYLMKYYPSERLPDRATFSKTCREMHYNMLQKKIFGMIVQKFIM